MKDIINLKFEGKSTYICLIKYKAKLINHYILSSCL